jgi:hypothetical protein
MLTIAKSELGETASRLLQEANGRTIVINDGQREVGALISIQDLQRVRRMRLEDLDRITQGAGERLAAHAAELGISEEELVERLLQDDE